MPDLHVRRLRPGAQLPRRSHPGDAGFDLIALDALEIPPGGRGAVGTGLAVAVPAGWAGLVMPRSGLARTHGVTVANAPGVVDSGYRGEVIVVLANHGVDAFQVEAGQRVAQLVLTPVATGDVCEVAQLPDSDGRGGDGFGSTGR